MNIKYPFMTEKMRITGPSPRMSSRNHGGIVLTIPTAFCLTTAVVFILNILLLKSTFIHDTRSTELSYIRRTMPIENTTVNQLKIDLQPSIDIVEKTSDKVTEGNMIENTTIYQHETELQPSIDIVERSSEKVTEANTTTPFPTSTKTSGIKSFISEDRNTTDKIKKSTCVRVKEKCRYNWWAERELLRSEWARAGPRLISVRGERHSGTKLAGQLIQNNAYGLSHATHGTSYMNEVYGWKHGFFHSDGQVHPSDIILVMTRDVFSWALSMFKEPYNMIFEEGMTEFKPFLMGHYQTQQCEANFANIPRHCTFPMEEAENIIQLRTAKYKNWTSLEHTKFAIMKLEDLVQDQRNVMMRFFDQYGIDHGDFNSFRLINGYVDTLGEVTSRRVENQVNFAEGHPRYSPPIPRDYLNYTIHTERERYLAQYTVEEIQFVLSNIDRDFEREILKYSYDDVDIYIDDRIAGRKLYEGPPKLNVKLSSRRSQLIRSYDEGTIECTEYHC